MTETEAQKIGQMSVTVILCSYNRCGDLAGALESVAASQMPSSVAWEVLVVDNNSTDQTREVIEGFCRKYPGIFRYLLEPTPGKSYALNAGIANARGDVLVFTDDDVTMEPGWLENLTAPFQGGECAGTAGRTLPAQKFTVPPWLPDNHWDSWAGILCAYFDLGDNPCELLRPPYGANMAFRKSLFEKHGGFRLDLGPRPGNQIRNEDTELGRRLLAAGERLRYVPTAVVYHPVPEGRITQEYFLSWWFDYARALILERGDRPSIWGIPYDYFSMARCALRMSASMVLWTVTIDPKKRFKRKIEVWKSAGQLLELSRRNRPEKKERRDIGQAGTPKLPRSESVRSADAPSDPF
jgi:glycosyltransferase involved in cell wall biosynthesis